ncbi:MAG: histidine phosphatase family protein [Candidatus Nanopelagicales bacterium]|nr:histidine phosphatase family protein [Candidatus Nanopelagicales bacterium]
MERVLIVMRHAKSAWPMGVRDFDRPLGARGRRNAPASGRWISQRVSTPDQAVVSSANRTRLTWQLVEPELAGRPADVDFRPGLYAATWWDLLDVVRTTPEATQTLMLLGHNPSVEDLVTELAGTGESRAMRQLRVKFPTSAVAVLTSDLAWREWGSNCARLQDVFIPPR